MDLIAALRTFLRVAETGSFSAVATEYGVTQPAISRQVGALEAQFGARLVHRSSRAVTLTDEGRDRADQALAGLLEQERAILAELSRTQRGELAGLLRQLTAPFDNIPG